MENPVFAIRPDLAHLIGLPIDDALPIMARVREPDKVRLERNRLGIVTNIELAGV